MIKKLQTEELRIFIDPTTLNLDNIEEILPLETIKGQDRAIRALEFGIGNKAFGFNIYVSGYPGTGRMDAVKNFISNKAKEQETPPDWCYVNNFDSSYHPNVLQLPTGRAIEFKNDMKDFVQDSKNVLSRVFEGEEYVSQKEDIIKEADSKKNEMFLNLNNIAKEKNFTIQNTPFGISPVPVKDQQQPMTNEDFKNLEKNKQEEILKEQEKLKDLVKNNLRKGQEIEKEANHKIKELDKNVAKYAIEPLIENLKEKYASIDDVINYLNEVKKDIVENFSDFVEQEKDQGISFPQIPGTGANKEELFKRYEVNVLVDNSKLEGAPIVQELNPTYNNLFGKVEKESRMGALTTDFSMIKGGALQKANGGYLIIPVIELFKAPFSWDSLKNALINREIKIEEASEKFGFIATKSLSPCPIPLNLQIVLIGRPEIYHLLFAYDNDFQNLFKVKADFDLVMENNPENTKNYAAYVEQVKNQHHLKDFDPSAIAKLVEHGSRLAGEKNKITTRFGELYSIIIEANYYATSENKDVVTKDDITKAINEKIYRTGLIQEKMTEMIRKNMILVDVEGKKTGQVNGLAVLDLQDTRFGRPVRITATTGVGGEGIIDIERESKLGGKIHSKGIMILSGYLTERYAKEKPINLSARIVFEQSYSEVEGDSASCAELYSLLSSLSGTPLRQDIAVTGSVNQKGQVQAVGGINEKIEGFFEICKIKGLTGSQGVIIPESNIQNLVLKEEVVDAVTNGKFNLWSVNTIDEGMEILTGIKSGIQLNGHFEENSVNALVDNRISQLDQKIKDFAKQS